MNASPSSWRLGLLLALAAWVAGCAHQAPPRQPPAGHLLNDSLFNGSAVAIDRSQVFALSLAMQRYADAELRLGRANVDPRRTLLDALYTSNKLRLRYDAGSTRNAAEAFAARAGNCLSLVIMTAAFARHLGLPASFRQVLIDETYTRTAGLTLANGHVNLLLERLPLRARLPQAVNDDLTVDFLPGVELRGRPSLPLQEQTIVAMYFNNRAAEALAQGTLAQSYAWARAAVLEDPGYTAAANTLAVIYMRGGHLPAAEAALRHVLAADSESTSALSNLKIVLQRAGRQAEADTVAARLLQLQPYPPFHFYELGRQAMARDDFSAAREHFVQELRRQPYQHEVHFWAAQAHWRLGDSRRAANHLRLAIEHSSTPGKQQLYAAKLDHLRSQRAAPVQ